MSSLKATGKLEPGKTRVTFGTFIFSDYYNVKNCAWEPLLEN